MSKVGYDYKTMDLTPEIIKKYRGSNLKKQYLKLQENLMGLKLNELTQNSMMQLFNC